MPAPDDRRIPPHDEISSGIAEGGKRRVIFVVLAAYNEASNLKSVLEEIEAAADGSQSAFRAILVNDGSSDATADVARSFSGSVPLSIVEHPVNLGLGAAIRDGIMKALEAASAEDVVVTMDADNSHTPLEIARMVSRIDRGFDVVIASRYRKGAIVAGVPFARRFLSYAASVLFRIILPVEGVRDYTCGYRVYRASVLRDAFARYHEEFINQGGFQCMVDILLKLHRMKVRFGEEPLILRYDLKHGVSKMRVCQTACKTLQLLFRRRFGL